MGHEHAHADPNDPFQRRVAISMAVYAVLLAFMTMLTNQSRTEALLLAAEGNDQWAYYQSKSTKQVVVKAEADLLVALLPAEASHDTPEKGAEAPKPAETPKAKDGRKATPTPKAAEAPALKAADAPKTADAPTTADAPKAGEGAKAEARTQTPAQMRERLEKDAERYDKEKETIQEKAKEIEQEGKHEKHKEHWFEYASTAVELAIILATVGLLLSSKKTFFASMGLAGAAVVLAIYTAVT